MLNLTEIAARIKQPELCVASDIDSLKTLCETYPYSQLFPLLYLKTLAKTNDVRLDSELQKYAFRISNRAVLFDLLHNREQQAEKIIIPVENEVSTTFIETETIVNTQEVAPLQEIVTPVVVEEIQHESDEKQPIEIVEEKALEIVETTEITQEATNPIEETHSADSELPSIEEDLLLALNIPTAVYSLEAEETKKQQVASKNENEVTPIVDLEAEKQKLIAALTASKPLIPVQSLTETDVVEEKKEETQEIAGPRSFTSWLKSSSQEAPKLEQDPIQKVDPTALIDRFIQTEPKISPAKEKLFEDRVEKKELYNPTKKAKESLDDSQLPVSETLAKIFAAQGNYPKAISAYQQLMLIFPEKKVFFASQIEDLNKKLNT